MKTSALGHWLRDRRRRSLLRKRLALQAKVDRLDERLDQLDIEDDTELTVDAIHGAMEAAMNFPWKKTS